MGRMAVYSHFKREGSLPNLYYREAKGVYVKTITVMFREDAIELLDSLGEDCYIKLSLTELE